MTRKPRRVYWDASVFLSLFQAGNTPDLEYQREQAILLLEEARKGETLIITSTFTLAEARRGEGVPPLPGDEHATLRAFFKHSYIEAVPVDRAIAELAADYGERFSLRPGDAVQMATAVRVGASVFLAWDRNFHRREAMKDAPILIEEPKWTGARQLPLEDSSSHDDESLSQR
ncbi:MAG TPA: type II toxin-antitoxin system VapC family toxin [Chloroflexota bacterium]|jgi:predicted nucleic acid-binding protein